MNKKQILLVGFCICIFFSASAGEKKEKNGQDLKENFNNFIKQAKNTFDGAAGVFKMMGQSFDFVGKDYQYSFRVFNDTPAPIFVAEQHITGVMGANFYGNITKSLALAPNSNTEDAFIDRHLYLSIWLSADPDVVQKSRYPRTADEKISITLEAPEKKDLKKIRFFEKPIYQWQSKDKNVYFYHVYFDKGAIKAETLDVKGTTPLFLGQFFNNTDEEITLVFQKDDIQYKVTLEPRSFNFLQSSDKENSIRPPAGKVRGFQFYRGAPVESNAAVFVPLAAQGIGNITREKNKDVVKDSLLYTYEIYVQGDQLRVEIQGLGVGNFSQPTNNRVRDINPARCSLWLQSAQNAKDAVKKEQEAKKETAAPTYATIFFDPPEQVWISYSTADYSFSRKIKPGEIIDFNLIRPRLSEKEAWLFVTAIQTDDDAVAKQFLNKLSTSELAKKAIVTDVTKPLQAEDLLVKIRPNRNGTLVDPVTKMTGVVLLADCFLPQGVGAGTFYYIIEAPVLQVDQFANAITFDKKYYEQDPKTGALTLKNDELKEFSEKVVDWITNYPKTPDTVKQDFKQYLLNHVDPSLLMEKVKEFNGIGEQFFNLLLTGPISLKYYPMVRKAGINFFVFGLGALPPQWPSKK